MIERFIVALRIHWYPEWIGLIQFYLKLNKMGNKEIKKLECLEILAGFL
jgi:hypothetical protein